MKKIVFLLLLLSITSFSQEATSIKNKIRSFDLLQSNNERENKIKGTIDNFILNNKSISVDTLNMDYGLLIDEKGLIFITYNKINDDKAYAYFNKLFKKKYRIKPFKDSQNLPFSYIIEGNNKYTKQSSKYKLCTKIIHEKVPIYPGCQGDNESLKKCMYRNISRHVSRKFNLDLINNLGLQPGVHKISTRFTIDKNGEIKNITVKAPHPILKVEVIRIIKLLPLMISGEQKGKKVQVQYNLPIMFNVEETKFQKKIREKATKKRKN